MALISLTEYGKLRVGDLDPSRPSVTQGQATALSRLKELHGFEVFRYVGENMLSAQQYVGVVQLGGVTLEVLPKIEGIDQASVRKNLVAMLALALDVDISERDVARVATQKHGILEILIKLFCDKLFAQVHRGLVRRYEAREENLPVLRGKLGVVEQVRQNAANPERLYCRFDEFHEDSPLNQILKACIRLLLRVSRELINQRKLAELLLIFEGVSDVPRQSLLWRQVTFDRLNTRYIPSFKLAELFLKKTPPDVNGGKAQGFSLFFDMNALFEEYIGRLAIRIFRPEGYRIVLQGPRQYLVSNDLNGQDVFAMKPDVTALRGQSVAWIMDTKWKQLSLADSKEGVAQADMYQMYAYSNRYACPEVILLYPHHSRLGPEPGIRASYRLKTQIPGREDEARIRVVTVDLREMKTVPLQLASIFSNANKLASAA